MQPANFSHSEWKITSRTDHFHVIIVSGHTLDLIVTRNFDQLIISPSWAKYLFSNHIPVPFNVQIGKPTLEKNTDFL